MKMTEKCFDRLVVMLDDVNREIRFTRHSLSQEMVHISAAIAGLQLVSVT